MGIAHIAVMQPCILLGYSPVTVVEMTYLFWRSGVHTISRLALWRLVACSEEMLPFAPISSTCHHNFCPADVLLLLLSYFHVECCS